MKLKEKFLNMYNSDKVYLAEWLLAIVTGMFVFATSATWDLQSLTQWSVNVWHSIANGNFRGLYAYTAQNVYHVHHAHMGSELMSVLPWSVWNLPLFFIQRSSGAEIAGSALMLAYSETERNVSIFLVFMRPSLPSGRKFFLFTMINEFFLKSKRKKIIMEQNKPYMANERGFSNEKEHFPPLLPERRCHRRRGSDHGGRGPQSHPGQGG